MALLRENNGPDGPILDPDQYLSTLKTTAVMMRVGMERARSLGVKTNLDEQRPGQRTIEQKVPKRMIW